VIGKRGVERRDNLEGRARVRTERTKERDIALAPLAEPEVGPFDDTDEPVSERSE